MKIKVGFVAPDRGCLNTLIQNSENRIFEIYATGKGRYLFIYDVPENDPQDIRGYILEFQNFIDECTVYIQNVSKDGYQKLPKQIEYDGFWYFKSFWKFNTHISFDMKRKNDQDINIPWFDQEMFNFFNQI